MEHNARKWPPSTVCAGRVCVGRAGRGSLGEGGGKNGDGNQEIWFGSTSFSPSDPDAICNTPNLPIPNNDPTGVTDTQTVASTKTVSDLDVYVRIAHNAVRDLIVTLQHTGTGTTVTLRPGTPPGQGCRRNNIAAILDDETASSVENECVNQATTIFGTRIWKAACRFS